MKIIKISAIWCASCIIMNNHLAGLKNQYNLDITELDYDFDDESKKYNPGKILPVLIFLNQNNEEIKRVIGEKSIKELMMIFDEMGVIINEK